MLPKGVEECQRAGNVKRTSRTDRKRDGLVADLELRLEAVAMRLLGRIGAKGLTPRRMQGPNQSVGNQDTGRLDAALEHRDGKSDVQRLSLVQGLPFSRSGCQKTGKGVGPQGYIPKAPVWELDYCREGEWGRGLRRNRIRPITQMQQTVTLEAWGRGLQWWAQKLGPMSAYLGSLKLPGQKQSVTVRENRGLSVTSASFLCSQ